MSKFQVQTRKNERSTAILAFFERLGRPSLYHSQFSFRCRPEPTRFSPRPKAVCSSTFCLERPLFTSSSLCLLLHRLFSAPKTDFPLDFSFVHSVKVFSIKLRELCFCAVCVRILSCDQLRYVASRLLPEKSLHFIFSDKFALNR